MRSSPSGRCVIRSTVRPSAASSTSSISASAVAGSRWAVGSSSTSTGASASSARASDEPLALPARQPRPLLADERVEPVGERGDPLAEPRPAQRVLELGVGRRRAARAGGSRGSSSRRGAPPGRRARTCRARPPGGTRARRGRRSSPGPPRDRGSGSRRFVTVVFPAPLGPTSATLRPGSSRRSKPREHGRPRRRA